jgi:hypothetical protein
MRAVGFRRCRHGTAIAAAGAGMPQYLALACRHGTAICHAVPARHGICRHLRHVEVMPSYWPNARDASLSHQDVLPREKLVEQKGKTIPHRGFDPLWSPTRVLIRRIGA